MWERDLFESMERRVLVSRICAECARKNTYLRAGITRDFSKIIGFLAHT